MKYWRRWAIALPLGGLVLWFGGRLLWRQNLTLAIAAGHAGGDYHKFATALAQVLPNHVPLREVKVRDTSGATENMALLQKGKVQLALVQNDTPATAQTRSIASLYPEIFHVIVKPDRGIRSIPDLRGKRMAVPPRGSGSYPAFWRLAAHYGLTAADIPIVEMTSNEADAAFRANQVDGIFRIAGLGNERTRNLLRSTPGQLLAIDQAAAMKLFEPYLDTTVVPKGAYRANPPIPSQDLPVASVQALLVVRADVPEELVREITATLFENRSELVALNPRMATIDFPGVGLALGLPLHPGAKAYYDREKPSFLQENAEPLSLLMAVATLVISSLWQLRSQLSDNQKNRADAYNLQLVKIVEETEAATDVQDLMRLRQELLQILRAVIEDLDGDRLSPESYQLFVFPWETAMMTLRHREVVLQRPIFPPGG
ncbi:MAG TPA: C4-dicarboxylate ABC transporter substrate-binding protein [Cyanobacteria bacterium UBA8156]|nr:C4-dicarboxylate ABC transporter substrate-binding protein [Cyanobacteria bacterium UBA8156]